MGGMSEQTPQPSPAPVAQSLAARGSNRSQRPTSPAFREFISGRWGGAHPPRPAQADVAPFAAARRARLGELFPGERLVIPAGPLRTRSNDTDYRFRPHSAFAHLTGLGTDQEPDAVLVLHPVDGGHEAVLYARPMAGRDTEEFFADPRYGEFWVGARPSLDDLAALINETPEGAVLHPRVAKIYEDRRKMVAGELPGDWGFAENLAYATLLSEGYRLRLVGQDCGRGTFFHRHAILHDQKTDADHMPLRQLTQNPEDATIIDSLLSEEAVMAFEYGYATADPMTLDIWEAQFGDFANGAQVVIDQFLSSGEAKWGRICGLALFLPHGYEGQGPEHSSARLERFLQLCALDNMMVCTPTTPAQAYHMIRRQMRMKTRKPLVVMTPKSLLRHKLAVSTLEDLANGSFQHLIPDSHAASAKKVERVIVCGGKVYYDLLEEAQKRELKNVAIVRVEQLYPFPRPQLVAELKKYGASVPVVWCQEEPQNQGAWYQIQHHLRYCLQGKQTLHYAGRSRSPSPAVGHFNDHVAEQQALIADALVNPLRGEHAAE